MPSVASSSALPKSLLQKYSKNRFGFLLLILVILLGGSPLMLGFGMPVIWFDSVLCLVLLASIHSLCFERRHRMFALLLGIPTVLLCLGGHAFSGTTHFTLLFIGHLCGVLFFLGSAILVIKSLFSSDSLNFDSIFGAVSGYLFLGLAWAMAYSMIETFQPNSFHINLTIESEEESPEPYVLMYFSFVTLTTLGYGDIVPISPTTRTLAWLEAVNGQFYVAIIVAGIVSMLVAKNSSHPRVNATTEEDDEDIRDGT